MSERITGENFRQRLVALCTRAGGSGLPRKQRDRHILFQSAAMTLEPSRSYTEADLNEALLGWLEGTGRVLAVDHVTLRRHLVDERYLQRDSAGNSYRLDSHNDSRFDPEVLTLDPDQLVTEKKAERAAKRKAYTRQRS